MSRGRKKGDPIESKICKVQVLVTLAEWAHIQDAAKQAGKTVSDFCRGKIV